MTFIAMRRLIVQEVKKRAESLLGAPYNASFIRMEMVITVPSSFAELLPIFETIPMKFGRGGTGD